jgi:pyruvate/2-oxoglutarate dehydrogenase complex dihydrolipoamide dehydrogenase (E3) component/uncharacterized membrane protein YdjX (TVP38/TMEM64 family)
MKRLLILAGVALAIGAFFAFHLQHQFTLAALKSDQHTFQAIRSASPWAAAAGFFALYVCMAALSLPGAAILTVAAGALFGIWEGTALVSFASAVGATGALGMARYVLRDGVQRRFSTQLAAINQGVRRDGEFYLLTLRLIPVFPFFLVNILMGLTPIRVRTFYWVSQCGMLPATLVFVNAGTQLARIETLAGIASPAILLSLTALGVFPWIARGIVQLMRRRRVYARWPRPVRYDCNLVVIGAGAAGLVSAFIAATVRAKVTLVESQRMGGDCLNYGCVPSKALIRTAKLAHQMRHADRYGLEPQIPAIPFRSIMARVRSVIETIAPHDSVLRYEGLGVDVLEGHATFVDPWTIEIALAGGGTRRLTARSTVIAAGAAPIVPAIPGIAESGYVTSETLWDRFAQLDAPPRRLLVLGGGPVGCELAQCFARLGSRVTLVQAGARLLPREDEEISALVREVLEREGVAVLLGHRAVRCERSGAHKRLIVDTGGAADGSGPSRRNDATPRNEAAQGKATHGSGATDGSGPQHGSGTTHGLEFDELLCAVGRAARLDGYGLQALGIATEKTIVTNEYLETLYPNIFAAGDVAGPYQLTHVAAHQAWYATVNALFGGFKRFKVDYSAVPWTTFTDPEVAHVGLNEQDARTRGIAHEVTRWELRELDRAITDGRRDGFIKVLSVPGKDRILGVTLVGEHAGELIAEWVLAMKAGLGLNKILGTIHTYPTLAEANKYAAGEWKRAHAPRRLLGWSARYHAWRRG